MELGLWLSCSKHKLGTWTRLNLTQALIGLGMQLEAKADARSQNQELKVYAQSSYLPESKTVGMV